MGHPWKDINLQVYFRLEVLFLFLIYKLHLYIVYSWYRFLNKFYHFTQIHERSLSGLGTCTWNKNGRGGGVKLVFFWSKTRVLVKWCGHAGMFLLDRNSEKKGFVNNEHWNISVTLNPNIYLSWPWNLETYVGYNFIYVSFHFRV